MTFTVLPAGATVFLDANTLLYIQVLAIPPDLLDAAAAVTQQTGLLHNDSLIVALMGLHGLTNLASADTDFDRVPGITRYAAV
jgi:predicted nucleic acid-binding protein